MDSNARYTDSPDIFIGSEWVIFPRTAVLHWVLPRLTVR